MSSGFSVTQALKAAVAFLPRAWAGAWLVLLLMVAAMFGLPLLMMHHQLPLMAFPVVLMTVLVILKIVAQGALYRLALFGHDARAEGLGFGGVQFGRPEWRLLWAAVFVSLFILMIVTAVSIVFAIAFSMSGLAAGYDSSFAAVYALIKRHSGADYIFIVYLIAALFFLVFLSLKLVLVPVANIGGRKFVTLNALGLTTGSVGRLCLGLLTLVVPFFAIGLAVARYSGVDLHRGGQADGGTIALHIGLLVLAIFGLFPLIVGFLTSAYRQIMAIRSK
jgi:hypothetical protein